MKLYPEQLRQNSKTPLKPIYLIAGPEAFLRRESLDLLRYFAKAQGFQERTQLHADGSFNWDKLQQAASTPSLFSEKTFIELYLPSGKPGAKGAKAIREYADNPTIDTTLIIICEKLENQKSAWCKAIDSVGVIIPTWDIPLNQLGNWMQQRLQRKGLQVTPSGLQLLVQSCEGNLLSFSQMMEKLRLLYGQRLINDEELTQALTDNTTFSVYDLMDNAMLGNIKKTSTILKKLQQEKIHSAIVLWAVTRELRELLKIYSSLQQGETLQKIMQANRIWPKKQPIVTSAIQRLNASNCKQLLQHALQIDTIIKGLSPGDAWNELLTVCLAMANKDFQIHKDITCLSL